MKFTSSAGTLLAAISRAGAVIPSRPALVAYSGVHLEVAAGKVTASASDGETTVSVSTKVTGIVAGSVLLPPKPVVKYLGTLRADRPVTVEKGADTEVTLTADGASPYRFKVIAASFPTAPALRNDKRVTDLSQLGVAVAAAAVSASAPPGAKDKLVQLVSDDTGVRLHSTDRYRLTRATLPAAASFGTFDGLLPVRVLELAADLNPTHVQVDSKGRIAFSSPDTTVTTRLISNMFPTVDSVLGATPLYTMPLPRAQIAEALRSLSSVAEPGVPLVVTLAGDEVTLAMRSDNLGAGEEVVALDAVVPSEIKFGVNLAFFEQALDTHSSEQVHLGWSQALQPLFLTSPAEVPVINVISPVQFDK